MVRDLFDRKRLRDYFRTNNLKQRDVAQAIGVTESTLSMILSGERKCSLATYAQLCALLNVPMGEFIRQAGQREISP